VDAALAVGDRRISKASRNKNFFITFSVQNSLSIPESITKN